MEVVNPCAALLSNYEVLTLLKELEAEHLARAKAAVRIKKEEDLAASTNGTVRSTSLSGHNHLEASENLRTIEVEAIGYLSSDYLPTHLQTDEAITKLTRDLRPFQLTKAEKLQIVNLAPTLAVELYVIVEELEDRFGDRMGEILSVVESSVKSTPQTTTTNGVNGTTAIAQTNLNNTIILNETSNWDEDADAVYDEDVYEDYGEGAGVEGDLDLEED